VIIPQWSHDQLNLGDAITIMDALPRHCAQTLFADPPFNIGYRSRAR
jgi:DNA modification methylase